MKSPLRIVSAQQFLVAEKGDLDELFSGCANRCYCRYWHFEGVKNAWLERCAFRPEENRDELLEAIRRGREDGHGLVAVDAEGKPLGWLKLAPREAIPKLRNQGVYKRLELGANEGVWTVVCLLVAESLRRKGVAKALIAGAEGYAKAHGATTLEALPRVEERELYDEEAFAGPWQIYLDAGYTEVAGERPYPVFRKSI